MDFWDERYAEASYAYGKEPNEFLKQYIAQLSPGRALFPAEGEGRNAVYAASLGWETDAFDTSEKGRSKALQLSAEKSVKLNYNLLSYSEFEGAGDYDLVAVIFNHMPPSERSRVHREYVKALKPGGILVLEAFTPRQLPLKSGGPKIPDMLYDQKILLDDFQELTVVRMEETQRVLSEGPFHNGPAELIQFIGKKKFENK